MADTQFKIGIVLGGESADAERAFKDTASAASKTERSIQSGTQANRTYADSQSTMISRAKTWGGVVVGALGVGAITSYVDAQLDLVAANARVAQSLGISFSQMETYGRAVRSAGLDQADFSDALRDMAVRVNEYVTIGTGEAADLFEQLNLNTAEFIGLDPDQILFKVADALGDVSTRGEKLVYLDQLMGDAGVAMIDLLDDQAAGFKAAITEAEKFDLAISDVDAQAMRDASGAMNDAALAAGDLANQVIASLAPGVERVADLFTDVLTDGEAMTAMYSTAATGAQVLALAVGSRLAGSYITSQVELGKKTAATFRDNRAQLAAVKAAQATAAAELKNIQLVKATLAAEGQLEAQRFKAQITAKGRMDSSLRLGEIRRSELLIDKQIATAQGALAKSTDAVTAAQKRLNIVAATGTRIMNGLKGSMALLGGPAGIAILAGASLLSYASSAESAEEKTRRLADEADNLQDSMRSLSLFQTNGRLFDVSAEVEQAKSDLASVEQSIQSLQKQLSGGYIRARDRIGIEATLKKQEEQALALKTAIAALESEYGQLNNRQTSLLSTGSDHAGSLSDQGEGTGQLTAAQAKLLETYEKSQTRLEQYRDEMAQLEAIEATDEKTTEALAEAKKNLGRLMGEEVERLKQAAAQKTKLAQVDQDALKAAREELAMLYMTARQRELYNKLKGLSAKASKEEREELVQLVGAAYDLEAAQKAAAEKTKKLAQEAEKAAKVADPFAKAWEAASERVDETFADMWEGAFDDFESFTDSMLEGFKKTLAEMAHQAITRPIVVPIMNSIGQAAGLPTTGSTDVAGGFNTGLANFSNLFTSNSIGSGFSSAGNWLVDNAGVGQNLSLTGIEQSRFGLQGAHGGGVFSGAANYSNATYGVAGIAGGYVGSLFGNDNGQYGQLGGSLGATAGLAASSSLTALGSFAGPIGALAGALIGGLVGSFIGPGEKDPRATFAQGSSADEFNFGTRTSAFGMFGLTEHEDMGDSILEPLDDLMTLMQTLDNAIADTRTAEQIDSITAALENFESTDVESLFVDRYRTIISASGSVFADVISQVTDPEKLSKALATGLHLESVMLMFGDQVQADVTAELEKYAGTNRFQGAIDAMTQGLSSLAVLTDSFKVLNLNFDPLAGGAVHAARELGLLAGSVQNLSGLQGNYYDRYFTEEEKLLRSRSELVDDFSAINQVLPETRDGFRELVEAQDLNTEAGRETYLTLLSLASGTDQYLASLQQQQGVWTGLLTDAYGDLLGREPDISGLEFYLEQLETGALTFEEVMGQIAASPEAAAYQAAEAVEDLSNTIVDFSDVIDQLKTDISAADGLISQIGSHFGSAQVYSLFDVTQAGSSSDALAMAESLYDQIIDRYDGEIDRVDELIEREQALYEERVADYNALQAMAGDIRSSLVASSLSVMNPITLQERLSLHGSERDALYSQLQSGDTSVVDELRTVITDYNNLARDAYASSMPYRDIYQDNAGILGSVAETLESLDAPAIDLSALTQEQVDLQRSMDEQLRDLNTEVVQLRERLAEQLESVESAVEDNTAAVETGNDLVESGNRDSFTSGAAA